jgi:uncharacterized protein (TIGR00725 family)
MSGKNDRKKIIGVIGAAAASPEGLRLAEEVGRLVAEAGAVLVCGGLGGVMEAASRGCSAAGGEVIGILPGAMADEANKYVTLPVPTNMGHARNVIIAHTAGALVAIEGEYGTISEAAIALKLGKKVFALQPQHQLAGVTVVESAAAAVNEATAAISR